MGLKVTLIFGALVLVAVMLIAGLSWTARNVTVLTHCTLSDMGWDKNRDLTYRIFDCDKGLVLGVPVGQFPRPAGPKDTPL